MDKNMGIICSPLHLEPSFNHPFPAIYKYLQNREMPQAHRNPRNIHGYRDREREWCMCGSPYSSAKAPAYDEEESGCEPRMTCRPNRGSCLWHTGGRVCPSPASRSWFKLAPFLHMRGNLNEHKICILEQHLRTSIDPWDISNDR